MIDLHTLRELDGADLPTIRRHVRAMLEHTPSFHRLGGAERTALARAMVEVLAFLTDPGAGVPRLAGAAARERSRLMAPPPPARALEQQGLQSTDARDALHSRLAERPGQVGNEMQGNVAGRTGDIMKSLVTAVDFPSFVSSLIEGVFTSIVNSSIKQMQEFGNYLKAVAMTLKDFAAQNSDIDEGRDYLAQHNPSTLISEPQPGGGKRLRWAPDADDEEMPDLKSLLGMSEDVDLEDDDGERKVAENAQLQVARLRQQQLATMVLMGINRIVVTEGEIKATVTFDVTGTETAHREAIAGSADSQTHADYASQYQYQRQRGLWGNSGSGSGSSNTEVNTRISTATASETNVSDARLESKAKLTGFVQVKFKSETFPLEKLANSTEMAAVQERAQR